MDQQQFEAIGAWLSDHRTEMKETLKSLVSHPSVKEAAAPGAPFGLPSAETLRYVEQVYKDAGFPTRLYPDSGYLIADMGAGDTSIGIFAHADVVPVGSDWICTEPFSPIEKDGYLIGRGVSDNKSGIVLSLFAARAIRELGLPLRSRLVLFTGSNEEAGMEDAAAFVKEQPMPDVSLVPDGGSPVGRGEKGILRFWAVCDEPLTDLISIDGGEAFNVVLNRLTAKLRYSDSLYEQITDAVRDDGTLSCTAENGMIFLTAEGLPRHAADPGDSVHALFRIMHTLSRCAALPESDRRCAEKVAAFTKDCYGGGFGIASADPVFGILTCINGMTRMENGILRFSYDVRYGTTWDAVRLAETVKAALADQSFGMELHSNRPGFAIPEDDVMLQTIAETFRTHTGAKDARPFIMSGGTYARYLRPGYSVSHNIRQPCPFTMPAGHGGAHQPDEMVSIDGLLKGTAVVTAMILDCDEALHKEKN